MESQEQPQVTAVKVATQREIRRAIERAALSHHGQRVTPLATGAVTVLRQIGELLGLQVNVRIGDAIRDPISHRRISHFEIWVTRADGANVTQVEVENEQQAQA